MFIFARGVGNKKMNQDKKKLKEMERAIKCYLA
jgi:hypothetical protein